jgi:hypothetical protein
MLEEGRKEDLANPLRPPDAPPPTGTKDWWKASTATAVGADGKVVTPGQGEFIAELASPRARGSNLFGRDDFHVGTPSTINGGSTSSMSSDEQRRGSMSSEDGSQPSREISHRIVSPLMRAASFTRGSTILGGSEGRRESGLGLLAMMDPEDRKVIQEGWLKKKSPSGIPGARPWQRRYFKLTRRYLSYTKSIEAKADEAKDSLMQEEEDKNSGRLYVSSMKTVMLLEKSKCRFIIVAQGAEEGSRSSNAIGDRMFELIADTSKESRRWVAALETLVGREKMSMARFDPKKNYAAMVGSPTSDPNWGTQSMDFRSLDLGSMLIEPLSPDSPGSPDPSMARSPPMGSPLGNGGFPRVASMGPAPSPTIRPYGLGPLNMHIQKRDSGFALGPTRPLSPTGGEHFALSPRNGVTSPTHAAPQPKKSGIAAALAAHASSAKKAHRGSGRTGGGGGGGDASSSGDTNDAPLDMPKAATPLPVSWLTPAEDEPSALASATATVAASPRGPPPPLPQSPKPVIPGAGIGSMGAQVVVAHARRQSQMNLMSSTTGGAAAGAFFSSSSSTTPTTPLSPTAAALGPTLTPRRSFIVSPPTYMPQTSISSTSESDPFAAKRTSPPPATVTSPTNASTTVAATVASPTNANAVKSTPFDKATPFDNMIQTQAIAAQRTAAANNNSTTNQPSSSPTNTNTRPTGPVMHKRPKAVGGGGPSAALMEHIAGIADAGQEAAEAAPSASSSTPSTNTATPISAATVVAPLPTKRQARGVSQSMRLPPRSSPPLESNPFLTASSTSPFASSTPSGPTSPLAASTPALPPPKPTPLATSLPTSPSSNTPTPALPPPSKVMMHSRQSVSGIRPPIPPVPTTPTASTTPTPTVATTPVVPPPKQQPQSLTVTTSAKVSPPSSTVGSNSSSVTTTTTPKVVQTSLPSPADAPAQSAGAAANAATLLPHATSKTNVVTPFDVPPSSTPVVPPQPTVIARVPTPTPTPVQPAATTTTTTTAAAMPAPAPVPIPAKISARPSFAPPASARAAINAPKSHTTTTTGGNASILAAGPPPAATTGGSEPVTTTGPMSAPAPVTSTGRLSSSTMAASHRVGAHARSPSNKFGNGPPPPAAGGTTSSDPTSSAPSPLPVAPSVGPAGKAPPRPSIAGPSQRAPTVPVQSQAPVIPSVPSTPTTNTSAGPVKISYATGAVLSPTGGTGASGAPPAIPKYSPRTGSFTAGSSIGPTEGMNAISALLAATANVATSPSNNTNSKTAGAVAPPKPGVPNSSPRASINAGNAPPVPPVPAATTASTPTPTPSATTSTTTSGSNLVKSSPFRLAPPPPGGVSSGPRTNAPPAPKKIAPPVPKAVV